MLVKIFAEVKVDTKFISDENILTKNEVSEHELGPFNATADNGELWFYEDEDEVIQLEGLGI